MTDTTKTTECETLYCDMAAEIAFKVATTGDRIWRMCTEDATRVYDNVDRNRRGGKFEFVHEAE